MLVSRLCTVLGATLLAGTAHAAELQLGFTGLGQAYSFEAMDGTAVGRLRSAELVRFNALGLGGGARFVSMLRLESDFGAFANDPVAANQSPRPELCAPGCFYAGSLASTAVSLLYGYVEVPLPRTTLRLGRQVSFDPVDLYAFDGARVRVALLARLAIEATLGLEVRGEQLLGYTPFTLDGRQRQNDGPSPLVSLAVLTEGLDRTQARVGWRRIWVDGFAGGLTDQIAAQASQALWRSLRLSGGAVYDVGAGRFPRAAVQLGWDRAPLSGGVELSRSWPTFAPNSIFNFFSTVPYEEAALTGAWLRGAWRVDARTFARVWRNRTHARGGVPSLFAPGKDKFGIPQLDATAGTRVGGAWVGERVAVDGGVTGMGGYGGRRGWLDAGATWDVAQAWALDARLVAGTSQDDLKRRGRKGVQLGGRQALMRRTGAGSIALALEEDRFSGGQPAAEPEGLQVRAVVWVDLGWSTGGAP